jgi:hypothetical protein
MRRCQWALFENEEGWILSIDFLAISSAMVVINRRSILALVSRFILLSVGILVESSKEVIEERLLRIVVNT